MAKENKWVWILFSFLFSFCSSNAELTYRRELLFFFDKLEVRGAIDVFIRKGQRNREAYVYADSEIIDNIQLQVRDRTLFLDANNTFFILTNLRFKILKKCISKYNEIEYIPKISKSDFNCYFKIEILYLPVIN